MSLTKDAIDTITANAVAASGIQLDTHVPAILVPDGYRLQDIEHLQENPARFRGRLDTHNIEAFADYVRKNAITGQSFGFIDQDDMAAHVLFDLGKWHDPGFGEHAAHLELQRTAPYRAVIGTIGSTYSQEGLVDFIEDWSPHITTLDEDNSYISLPSAIHAIRNMRLEGKTTRESEIGDFTAKRSALDEIEAKSKGTLPRVLNFDCVPYYHLNSIIIHLRVAVLTGKDGPEFRLRWMNMEIQKEVITNTFREVLTDAIDDAVPLTLGTFRKS